MTDELRQGTRLRTVAGAANPRLERLTCRDCGMIRGLKSDWLPPDASMLAGGMEAWPSESSGGGVYLKSRNESP